MRLEESAARGRGRPRDIDKDEAIRTATWRVLAERGYDNMTFEAVAELARISRTTLYRRFATKHELVGSALYETSRALEREMVVVTDPRAALLAHTGNTVAFMMGDRGRAVLSITEASAREPGLAAEMNDFMREDIGNMVGALRAMRPGASDDAVDLAFSMLVGTVINHVVMRRQPLGAEGIEALVDAAVAILEG